MIQQNLVSSIMGSLEVILCFSFLIPRVKSEVQDKENTVRDVQVMLLSNITTDVKAASQLLQEGTPLEVVSQFII